MDNNQALGYMLLACKEAGIDKETVRKIAQNMYWQFDTKTEEEAEEQGWAWYRELD